MVSTLADRLTDYDATALAEAIAQRKLTSTEVVRAHLDRIACLNEKYNAIVTLVEEGAMLRASEADRALAQGTRWGPLHGVPITIKDSLQTQGIRTTSGYEDLAGNVSEQDAWVVEKLKQAGAIIIGKTNCARLCGDIQTHNEVFGTTNNPWDVERTSGGSSGGEAVAVALGMSPLGIGTDTGGSVRIPASYCGVFGFKPTVDVVPTVGVLSAGDGSDREDSLTVIGPIARSIRDLELCHRILTGQPTENDVTPLHPKLFWTQDFADVPLDDEVARVLDAKYAALLAGGVNVAKIEAPSFFTSLTASYLKLNMYEFITRAFNPVLYCFFWFFETIGALLTGGLRRKYRRLKADQAATATRCADFLRDCDCWVIPATPTVAFRHQKPGYPIERTIAGRKRKGSYFPSTMGFTCPINFLGNPSIVIPIGENADGLPIGIQLVGKRGDDLKLLRVAAYVWKAANKYSQSQMTTRVFLSGETCAGAT
jgi:amidase